MANITAAEVNNLRKMTGAGMMDCKKALVETNGDADAAAELLRTTGQAKAEKDAAVAGLVVAANRRPAVVRAEVPAAAADHAVDASSVIFIQIPFPHITRHI